MSRDWKAPSPPSADGMHVPTFGFVLEQTLGHVTHGMNLRTILSGDPCIQARWRPIAWDPGPATSRLPGAGNWTIRAGLQARRAIADLQASGPLDGLFIHTQVPAVLAQRSFRRIPTVVSVDATPLQYDDLGDFYGHAASGPVVERLKWLANRRCFAHAAHLVAWSRWAKDGLVDGYGVPPDKVTVIPPGVDSEAWTPPRERSAGAVVRVLFVGGDLERKGGRLLLEAVRALRREDVRVELDLVTSSQVAPEPGVAVHTGLAPNADELKALYHRADVFCLPTRGDCLPMVLSEAGAAGLPLVATDVGAISEVVRDGETGFLVPPDDVAALTRALRMLLGDAGLRRRQGTAAAELVRREFDAVINAQRLVEVLRSVAARSAAATGAATVHAVRAPGSGRGRDVLLTVSGVIPRDVSGEVEHGLRPRPDYLQLAEALHADLLDHDGARRAVGRWLRAMEPLVGIDVLMAVACLRSGRRYRDVVTDGEQVGLPYALLRRFRADGPRHHMIVHIMSVPKKSVPYRLLNLGDRIDTMFVYASEQQRYVREVLGFPADRIVLTPFQVDTEFFTAAPPVPSRTICAVGLEGRDYATLIEAARGLDARVVIAAASPWSKQADDTAGASLPDNVEVCQLGFVDLRQLYAESAFVVMPLRDLRFQAGVTTLLEAMSMARAVVCTRTAGQTDVVVQEETGVYVKPGDVEELREAMERLLGDPAYAAELGRAGRQRVERGMDVTQYAARVAQVVRDDVAAATS